MSEARTLVTGATGLIGRALAKRRPTVPLPRSEPPGGGLWWEPAEGRVHDDGRPLDAVVHLAGETVAGRWNARRKQAIVDSRVEGTRALVDWLASRPSADRPDVLVAASATGYYGDRGDHVLTEASTPGSGFLAELCVRWEAEARRAQDLGVRVVCLRIPPVLARGGGVLAQLEPLFRLGAGGPVGSGKQWFPWVHGGDLLDCVEWALDTTSTAGPYNLVAPGIVRQADFARALGRALHRPALLPAPAFALRLLLGEFADEALLASARATPERLTEQGFQFRHGELDAALADLYSP